MHVKLTEIAEAAAVVAAEQLCIPRNRRALLEELDNPTAAATAAVLVAVAVVSVALAVVL